MINNKSMIGFVFTNYNNSNFTKNAIESILKHDEFNQAHIVIIDNNSDKEDIYKLHQLSTDYPQVMIIYNKINSGYFKGLNIGIEYIRNMEYKIEYLVIGNNDLVFPKEFIQMITCNISLLNKYPVVSPDIITLDGIHQNPHSIKGSSKFREIIYDFYHYNYYIAKLILFIAKITKSFTDREDEKSFKIAQTIHQGYGACYIIGPIFFIHFKKLFAPTFLMGEEFFLSYQLSKKQLQIYYEPSIKVYHHDHATVTKVPSKRFWEISKKSHKIYRQIKPIF